MHAMGLRLLMKVFVMADMINCKAALHVLLAVFSSRVMRNADVLDGAALARIVRACNEGVRSRTHPAA